MKRVIRKVIPPLLLLSLSLVGCSRHGSQFVGKWVNTTNDRDTMEITRNGDQFLVVSPQEKLGLAAAYKDGTLQVPAGMGVVVLNYIESSGTIVAPGLLGQKEYRRVDHFANPGDGTTINTPNGSITTNPAGGFTADELGTDIYPGAQPAKGGMRMNLPSGSMVAANFLTSDSKDQVIAYYKSKFGSQAGTMETGDGAILTVNKSKQDTVMMTITQKPDQFDGKTQIHIMHTINNKAS